MEAWSSQIPKAEFIKWGRHKVLASNKAMTELLKNKVQVVNGQFYSQVISRFFSGDGELVSQNNKSHPGRGEEVI